MPPLLLALALVGLAAATGNASPEPLPPAPGAPVPPPGGPEAGPGACVSTTAHDATLADGVWTAALPPLPSPPPAGASPPAPRLEIDIDHPRVGALDIAVVAVSGDGAGTRVSVKPSRAGGLAADLAGAAFSDGPAAPGFPLNGRERAPFTGEWRSQEPLAPLAGADSWVLEVRDVAPGPETRPFRLRRATLTLCPGGPPGPPPSPPPEAGGAGGPLPFPVPALSEMPSEVLQDLLGGLSMGGGAATAFQKSDEAGDAAGPGGAAGPAPPAGPAAVDVSAFVPGGVPVDLEALQALRDQLAARIGAPRPARTPPALGPDDAARAAMMLVAAVAEGRLDGAVPDAAGLVAGLGLGATPGEIRDRLAALREGTVSDAQSLLSLTAGQGALRDRLRGLGA